MPVQFVFAHRRAAELQELQVGISSVPVIGDEFAFKGALDFADAVLESPLAFETDLIVNLFERNPIISAI